MEGLATDRLNLPAGRAPDGLALVQELVNTAMRQPVADGADPHDLLADAATANRWLTAALAQWAAATDQPAPGLHLADADLPPLRKLRESVRALAAASDVAGSADDPTHVEPHSSAKPPHVGGATLALRIDTDGRVRHGTSATGWRGIAALVTAEILLAQHTGTWQRFKACPFPVCGVAFYDESRNNSRVWHDVRTCGNRTNLAASRERRRSGAVRESPDVV